MKKLILSSAVLGLVIARPHAAEPQWYIKAHIDEACSCNLFCPCYFNPEPDGDRCNFNNVFSVDKGNYGKVTLDGMKVWISGNLNGQLAKGFDGVVLAFEPTASPEQVDAFGKAVAKVYGLPIAKVDTSDRTTINISHAPGRHVASRGDDKGHVELTLPDASAQDPKNVPVIKNLRYFAARNSGFNLYYGTHRYKGHGYDYAYTKRNGFTIDIEAGTPPAAKSTNSQ